MSRFEVVHITHTVFQSLVPQVTTHILYHAVPLPSQQFPSCSAMRPWGVDQLAFLGFGFYEVSCSNIIVRGQQFSSYLAMRPWGVDQLDFLWFGFHEVSCSNIMVRGWVCESVVGPLGDPMEAHVTFLEEIVLCLVQPRWRFYLPLDRSFSHSN